MMFLFHMVPYLVFVSSRYREGYLQKKGEALLFWRTRWFVLEEEVLSYYKGKWRTLWICPSYCDVTTQGRPMLLYWRGMRVWQNVACRRARKCQSVIAQTSRALLFTDKDMEKLLGSINLSAVQHVQDDDIEKSKSIRWVYQFPRPSDAVGMSDVWWLCVSINII